MVYITGDIHGDFFDLKKRIKSKDIKAGDTLIILGDSGFNFYLNEKDRNLKTKINELGICVFCIRGNHEARPSKISSYIKKEWNGAEVYFEKEFPNILFGIDGNVYTIEGKSFLVLGGAYSVDKYYRIYWMYYNDCLSFNINDAYFGDILKLAEGKNIANNDKKIVDNYIDGLEYGKSGWFNDEQLSENERKAIIKNINGKSFDVILSHTCPYELEPREVFLKGINQNMVDDSQEKWLQEVAGCVGFSKWYAGHFHINKKVNDKFELLFRNVLTV